MFPNLPEKTPAGSTLIQKWYSTQGIVILPCSFRCRRESGPSCAWESLRWPPNFSLKMRQRLDGGPPRDRVPLSIPVTLVPGEIFHHFCRSLVLTYSASHVP